MSGPLVSVIVPVHNGSRHLRQTLESIAAQSWTKRQVIVVDDASTDGSLDLARSFDVRTIVHSEQRGVASGRNEAVRAAQGEILAFLDQDDVWLPQALERHVEALAARPETLSILQEVLFLDGLPEWPVWMRRQVELLTKPHPAWVPSGLAVRRVTFDQVGWFDESFAHASDLDWFARARAAGIAATVATEVLLRRRIHADNDSHHTSVQLELMQALRKSAARNRPAAVPRESGRKEEDGT